MTGSPTKLAHRITQGLFVCTLTFAPLHAQDLPTDEQLQAAFGASYNHLGLMEYCVDKGFAKFDDVVNARRTVAAIVAGMDVSAGTRAQQEIGRRGDIVGPQVIGLMGSNPAHPEAVPEGQTMSLADNARAQKSSERILCKQMAEQGSAVVRAASIAISDR